MVISTNTYLYNWDNLYVYICLHAAIYQVICIQTRYLRKGCVGGGYLPICTGVRPVSPFKAFKQCWVLCALFNSPALTKLCNSYEGASVRPVDHHGTARGTEWALRPRSVSYEWVPEASKERGWYHSYNTWDRKLKLINILGTSDVGEEAWASWFSGRSCLVISCTIIGISFLVKGTDKSLFALLPSALCFCYLLLRHWS